MFDLRKTCSFIAMACLICVSCSENDSEYHFPKPIGLINDFADILPSNQEQKLYNMIIKHQRITENTIVVVTLKTIKPHENINTYATALFNNWGIGSKDKNNGLLFLIVTDDRKARIEIGLGLEEKLTNDLAKDIFLNKMIPNFKESRFFEGLSQGVSDAIDILESDS